MVTVTEVSRQILACAYSPSGDRFVTAGSDTELNVYDERTRQIICTMQPRYINYCGHHILFNLPVFHYYH